jgi:uncharacterized membrane protein
MITETSIEIDAPASTVWDVYSDVEGWPSWTASVTDVSPVDEPGLEVGRRFAISQPKFPRLVWEVTAVEPGRGWTWRQRSVGGTTLAHHRIEAIGDGRARVTQGVDQRGPVGVLVGVLVRRLTRRYLAMESEGLKGAAEERHRRARAQAS